jgi:hypothetical protein
MGDVALGRLMRELEVVGLRPRSAQGNVIEFWEEPDRALRELVQSLHIPKDNVVDMYTEDSLITCQISP